MRAKAFCLCVISCISLLGVSIDVLAFGQDRGRSPRGFPTSKTTPRPTPEPTPEAVSDPSTEPTSAAEQQKEEVLKTETDLVTLPVIATNRDDLYIPDLSKEELKVVEDGVKQEVAFFSTISAPFHVVLLLDTSASTRDALGQIRRAAIAFVKQLQGADAVKVISFAASVRELSEFTTDKALLEQAILKTESGQGTKLYDAFDLAVVSLRPISGRKAIVLFSDGVDWHSDRATFDQTVHRLDEEGVIVYPIRFDTRAESERIAREAANEQSPSLPTIGVIREPSPSGTTPPTFPSDDPDSVPTAGQRTKTGPLGLPSASEIFRQRREEQRRRDEQRDRQPSERIPAPGERRPQPDERVPQTTPGRTQDDSIGRMLDQLYLTADSYLKVLAEKTGGRLVRSDTVGSLPAAFAKIAMELRTQYSIGYYPTNKKRDGAYRKVKVTTTRKDALVRSRPGYRAPSGR